MPEKDAELATLRQQGTLNPRPRAVTDPLFAQDGFFDPRDLVQVKYEMLRRVQSEGHSVTGAATAFDFSRPSFYQALEAFQEDGLAAWFPTNAVPSVTLRAKCNAPQYSTCRLVAKNVEGAVVRNSGHWLMEEAPEQVIPKLVEFLGSHSQTT